jgi:hypothetical protein
VAPMLADEQHQHQHQQEHAPQQAQPQQVSRTKPARNVSTSASAKLIETKGTTSLPALRHHCMPFADLSLSCFSSGCRVAREQCAPASVERDRGDNGVPG